MKRTLFITTALLALAGTVIAQPGRGHGMRMSGSAGPGTGRGWQMLNLSEEQQAKFEEMQLANLKQMTAFHNRLAEKELKLHTLRTADTIDRKAIFTVIEDIGALKTDMAKARESFRLTLREQLTEDQRVIFDSRAGRGGFEGRNSHGRRGGRMQGRGEGRGMHTGGMIHGR